MPIRRVKDRELAPATIAARDQLNRKLEIDAQVLGALEVGNTFERLWTHPAGINPERNRGCCKPLHANIEQERAFCAARFDELAGKYADGTELDEIDSMGKRRKAASKSRLSEIKARGQAAKGRGEKFARMRAIKDAELAVYEEEGLKQGWLREVTQAEIVAEHEGNVATCLEQINEERASLGLPRMKIIEE